ncbi:cytochrome P450 [Allokutzneria multivorans]
MTEQVLTSVPDVDGGNTLFDWFRHMRDERPVWFDRGQYHVFRYDDVHRVITDPAVFSNDSSRVFEQLKPITGGNINSMDPPEHRRLRGLANTAFTPRVVARLESRIREVTTELLDRVDGDAFDLVESLTHPLPVIVIAELLGVPSSDADLFRVWVDQLTDLQGVIDPGADDFLEVFDAATRDMNQYLLEHCRARRTDPKEDLITSLVHAEVDGSRLTEDELVKFTSILFHTGHLTTTLMLGNAVQALDAWTDAFAELRADRSLIPNALEEVMRYRSPFTTVSRVSTRDVEVAGHVIPANSMVTPWVISANHDERRFVEPERFDIRRDTSHVAFGHGIHFCLGAPLARLEGRVALNVLFDRFKELRVDPNADIRYHPSGGMYGARNLPVLARRA